MVKAEQKKQTGFTLIELLVVISIIALLSSIALTSFNKSKTMAQINRLLEDEHSMQNQFDNIRDTKNNVMGNIVGIWCSWCDSSYDSNKTLNNQPAAWKNKSDNWWKSLGFAKTPLDPWGNLYLIDPNEGEVGYPCGRYDGVFSAGANGKWESGAWVVDFIPTLPTVVYGIGDDYLLFFSLYQCTTPAPPG